MRKPRTRRSVDEARLRVECHSLRYTFVMASLADLDDPQILDLLRRTRSALSDLELLVFAHDDSGVRFLFTAIGAAAAAISLPAILAGSPLAALAALAGAAVAVRDGAKLAETILRLKPDEELCHMLSQFLEALKRECATRGLSLNHE